ncbi:MAG: hypothetical protein ABSB84_01875 [Verrucomicrobiota bacterium]
MQEIAPSDAAILNIAVQGGSVVVSWPGSLANWQLQSCDSLSNPNWAVMTNTQAVVNGRNTIGLQPIEAQRFFRLKQVQ